MRQQIIATRVQGASHKLHDIPCQDSFGVREQNGAVLISVADGHGSSRCPYSADGSRIAVEVFCDLVENLISSYRNDANRLRSFLHHEGSTTVARSIWQEWKSRVLTFHNETHAEEILEDSAAIHLYGTTLLGLLAMEDFCFAFQLGDGDITYVSNDGAKVMLEAEKYLGTETNSMCDSNAWEKAVTMVWNRDPAEMLPAAYFLSTDGFANSFPSDEKYLEGCSSYFAMLKEHGADTVQTNLESWLSYVSEHGCGDDITLAMLYLTDDTCKNNEEILQSTDEPHTECDTLDNTDTHLVSENAEMAETESNSAPKGERRSKWKLPFFCKDAQ